jgi:hypothetical protein
VRPSAFAAFRLITSSNLVGRNIMHTVRYTELSPDRFRNFWED